MDLLSSFKKTLEKHNLLTDGDSVLVGLSGGPDSVALFDLLCQIKTEYNLSVTVAHYNHGLRGTESFEDERFVKKLCEVRDVVCMVESGDVLGFAKQKKLSIETAARELRYDFFERASISCGANVIATGHTANDQAETIMDRLLRGSGVGGLGGIPLSRDKFIRPLLFVQREEILEYLKNKNISFRVDSSNLDLRFKRNKIRLALLPLIERDFNPDIVKTLSKLSQVMTENEDYLRYQAEKAFSKCVKSTGENKIVLDILCFLAYFKVVQKYILKKGLDEIGIGKKFANFDTLEQIIANINHRHSGRSVRVGPNGHILVAGDDLVIARDSTKSAPQTANIKMEPEKCRTRLWDGLTLATQILTLGEETVRLSSDPRVEFIDFERVEAGLQARKVRRGDYFFPLNMRGKKKVSDFFIDEKVPLYKRAEIPILESGTEIVWVCGYRLDDRFKITSKTNKVLKLEILEEGGAT